MKLEPFDLEQARAGRPIYHVELGRAKDWHYFEGQQVPLHIQWEDGLMGYHRLSDPRIGFKPKRKGVYIEVLDGDVVDSAPSIVQLVARGISDASYVYEITYNPDGTDPEIKLVNQKEAKVVLSSKLQPPPQRAFPHDVFIKNND